MDRGVCLDAFADWRFAADRLLGKQTHRDGGTKGHTGGGRGRSLLPDRRGRHAEGIFSQWRESRRGLRRKGQRFDPTYLNHSMFYGLHSTEYKPLCFPKNNIGMMLSASTAVQAPSLLQIMTVSTFNRS